MFTVVLIDISFCSDNEMKRVKKKPRQLTVQGFSVQSFRLLVQMETFVDYGDDLFVTNNFGGHLALTYWKSVLKISILLEFPIIWS